MNTMQIVAIVAGVVSLVTGVFAVRVFWFPAEPIPTGPAPPLTPLGNSLCRFTTTSLSKAATAIPL